MAIIYSYPRIDEVQGSDLILVADASKRNQTKSASVSQLLQGQATIIQVDDRVVTGASFNTSDGVLTLTRNSGDISSVTTNLDGRYALTSSLAGTDRYIPRFDGNSSLINSAIYEDNSGNIGIGTQVPGTSKLKVIGNGTFGNADMPITLQVGEATELGSQIYSTLKLAVGGGNFHEFRGSRSTGEEGSRYRMEEYTDGLLVRMTQSYDGDITQILYGTTVSFSAESVNLSNVAFIEIREYIDHDGDSNTRFGFPANDTFAIDTDGVERMRINPDGTTQFTGQVTIPETPVAGTDAASKAYVDANSGGGGAVDSVNGETGTVVLTTSDITNDSGYVTGTASTDPSTTAVTEIKTLTSAEYALETKLDNVMYVII